MQIGNSFPVKLRKTDYLLSVLYKAGVFQAVTHISPDILTVLNYHRVADRSNVNSALYWPNISANPLTFARQMDYVRENYNVITCTQLAAWLRGEVELGPHSAIITFDDGYYDNLSNALPILFERGLSATIFLTTGYIGCNKPFYWDFVAYCFHNTEKTSVDLPMAGGATWNNSVSKGRVMKQWVNIVKQLPEMDKRFAVSNLPEALDVFVPDDVFGGLYLSWDQVRELTAKGIEMGSHTVNHPILTRIPMDQVHDELSKSKQKIETEIGMPVVGFAYPNGQREDFSLSIAKRVKEAGYEAGFTLLPGPTKLNSARENPLLIKRIFISYSDSYPRFIAKLSGLGAVTKLLERFRG